MKINNKGFTLVELLAVLAIIAIIGMIAIPNVISVVDNNKKDLMLQDAQKFVSLAKAAVMKDRVFRDDENKAYTDPPYYLRDLDTKETIKVDPDGGEYVRGNSYVRYYKERTGQRAGYCVYLEGTKRSVKANATGTDCVYEEELTNRKNVFDN